jgi:DNA mismatch repair ATPase MutL
MYYIVGNGAVLMDDTAGEEVMANAVHPTMALPTVGENVKDDKTENEFVQEQLEVRQTVEEFMDVHLKETESLEFRLEEVKGENMTLKTRPWVVSNPFHATTLISLILLYFQSLCRAIIASNSEA